MKRVVYLVSEDWAFINHRLDLVKKIQSSGFKVSLITNISNYKKKIEKNNIDLHKIKFNRGSLNLRKSLKDIYKIYKIYKKLKPDIVHHFGIRQIVHGNIAAKFAGVKKTFNSITGLGSIFISGNFFIRNFLILTLKISLLFKKSFLLLQNKDDLEFIKKISLPGSDSAYLMSASGVDVKKFKATKEPRGKVVFLFASRIINDKGINELIEASKILKSKKNNFELYIAGKTDSQNPSSVSKNDLERWESLNYIKYLGYIKNVHELYKKIHVCILPSYREGLPKNLLEAASSSKPIITTDVPGCREVVKNNYNGLLIQPGDSDAIIEAMKKMISKKKMRLQMGLNGRKFIKKNYSIKKTSKELLSLYNKKF